MRNKEQEKSAKSFLQALANIALTKTWHVHSLSWANPNYQSVGWSLLRDNGKACSTDLGSFDSRYSAKERLEPGGFVG